MLKTVTRTSSFFSKWLAEVVRQPSLMVTLVVGPFLILLAFGQGVTLTIPQPDTMVVVPEGQGEHRELNPDPGQLERYLDIAGTTPDLEYARSKLEQGDVDLVAVLPPDPLQAVKQGQRAPVHTLINEIDPVRQLYAHAYLHDQVATLNQQAIEKAIQQAQDRGAFDRLQQQVEQARRYVQQARAAQGDVAQTRRQVRELKRAVDPLAEAAGQASAAAEGVTFVLPGLGEPADQARRLTRTVDNLKRNVDQLDARLAAVDTGSASSDDLARVEADLNEIDRIAAEYKSVPPWVLSAPFELQEENVAPFVPSYIGFYTPAVLSLLLQHLAVTLSALSMARIRLLGLMELLRTAPARPAEVVVGNYLSYGLLCAVAGGLLVALLVGLLGVPMFGSYVTVAAVLVLLVLVSLGLGFVISMIAASEQQAAQIAMLVLIASVFFSGFIVRLNQITWPVRAVAYLLPTTYAIRTLQDVMLRGVLRTPTDLAVLLTGAVVLFFLTIHLFRREYRPG